MSEAGAEDRLAPLLSAARAREPTLVVSEVYASVQGESSFAGLPCAFVRLAACNLRCRWCDSSYTFNHGTPRSVAALRDEVLAFGLPLAEVTGGEPLLQPPVHGLMRELLDAGMTVLIETSGAVDIAPVDPRVVKIVDVKCPGSGEAERNLWSNLDHLGARDELKFVIADRRDYDWAKAQIASRALGPRARLLLSPVHGELEPQTLVAWMLADRLEARLNLQLHKVIWPAAERGV